MEVKLTAEAERQIKRLNEPMYSRIIAALVKLQHEPPEGDIKPLKGRQNTYRVRVGKYRILYTVEAGRHGVFRVAPRGEAYREI